ncbi:hypothetical protein SAMN05216349_10417 [Oribacterium sp. KHPX15]|uniref:hypothetical protein n=1 Tax=Oribacterium sp. KHPX15 TaxID=1855342 RepID=UPI000898CCC3|nr:hypothetical protein [Oribacterium sp. KHPX15]SEA04391.1 hypothetical protein SAMN05216349_10417 [Oribacterium sp. KHPX15]
MTFDTFESSGLDTGKFDLGGKMSALHSGFESSISSKYDAFMDIPDSIDKNISNWLGTDVPDMTAVMSSTKEMYNGTTLDKGKKSLGLKEISEYKINKDYENQNIRQHAGYAAEVISTTKENLIAEKNDTGVKTFRTDDLPDEYKKYDPYEYKKNDPYVDKIRIDRNGSIERIQVKFVGKDASECLSKLASKKYDKYFNDGKVDKMEIPKDYYDDVKTLIPKKISNLEGQLQRVRDNGNVEAAQKLENQIERYKKIDQMVEKSTVSSDEAIYAVKHPERYTTKLFVQDTFVESHKAGMDSAAIAVTITAAVSTVDNVAKVMDGEITPQEAFIDVATDTGVAGGISYGTAFVSTTVSQSMSASSHHLIKSLGKSGIPAAVISFGVQSYDSVVDYATGQISGNELAYDLGENAAQVGGSIAGAAIAGAAVGSVVPGAGTVVGFGAGMVGGMIGCAVASEAYVSAVEFGSKHIDELADKAKEMADNTVSLAKEIVPDKVGNIVTSLNDFATSNHLPFSF